MLFRGFSNTRARLLLHMQTDIADLESELDELDNLQDSDDSISYRLRCYALDKELGQREGFGDRQQLLVRLQEKLLQYGQYMYDLPDLDCS